MSKPLFVRPLSVEERYELEAHLRSDNTETRQRAWMVLESAGGRTAHEIATKLDLSPENVKRWVRRFNVEGFSGIRQRKRGPEPRFTDGQIAALRSLAAQPPAAFGYAFETWSAQKLAEAARTRGIVDNISHVTVRKLLSDSDADAKSPAKRNGTAARRDVSETIPPDIPSTLKPQEHIRLRIAHLENELNSEDLPPDREADVRCALSEAYENIGRYPEALSAVECYDAPDAAQALDPLRQAHTRLRLGWGYSWQGNQPRALARLNEALRLFLNLNFTEGVGAAHYAVGRTYAEINEFKIGRDRIWQGLRLMLNLAESDEQGTVWNRETPDMPPELRRRTLMARMHLSLGVIDFCEGTFDAAKKNYIRALELAGVSSPDRNLLGLIVMNLALIHDQMGERKDAKKYYEQAIEHFTVGGHEGFLARCRNNLGESLMHHGLWTQAAEHLERALALAERQQVRENEALTLITLAELRLLQGQLQSAELHLGRAVELLIDGDKWAEAYARRVLGKVYLASGREAEGFAKLQSALQMTTDIGDQHGVCLSYLELADYHLEHGGLEQAETSLETARELLKDNAGFYAAGVAQRLTGRIEAANGRYTEAQQHFLQSISTFTTNDDRYEVGVSRLEIGRLWLDLSDYAQAGDELRRAEELFVTLGAETAVGRVRELLQRIETATETALPPTASLPPSESLLLQRLIEACGARELLLRELAAVLRENFAASVVVVWETDGGSLPKPLLISPETETDAERLAVRGEELLAQGRRASESRPGDDQPSSEWARVLFERDVRRVGLYTRCDPVNSRLPFRVLASLLKQVALGLEISALRTTQTAVSPSLPPAAFPNPTPLIPGFIYGSPAMREVVDHIRKIRTSDVTVLITGESGTGKELIARAIHSSSARRDAVFVPFNCTATPRDLIESQLFGHRRGAFTGAVSNYSGIIRAAAGGTLFLDEIGDLTLETQPKLMRFLQEGEIQPLGETKPVKVDVRVLAATNVDLERSVNEGRFREDLFHRLNIIRIHIPPLRMRREEIPPLAAHYLEHFCKRDGKRDLRFSQEALDALVGHDWSGNVRQLRNEIERVVAFSTDETLIVPRDLSPEIVRQRTTVSPVGSDRSASTVSQRDSSAAPPSPRTNGHTLTLSYPARASLREAVERLETQLISEVLDRTGGNISRAARELGLSRRGLRLKMEQLGLGKDE